MLDGLKPYPEYKDSGQPWLGAVPAHWHIERLDRLFRLRSEWPVEGDQRITGYLDGRVTLRSNVAGQKIKGVVKEAGWQRVHPGDFAISGMNAHLGGMGVSDSLGKCSPIYLVLIPKPGTNAAFVSRCVRHIAHSDALKVLVSTIRFNSADFKRDHLKLIWVQVPPSAEQAGIVRFLGAVDRKVNRFIRAKRRLIEVLTEQKQAIITHAVTKGLNPSAPLKPSGIDWLQIPEHWEVKRLKTVGRIRYGLGQPPKESASGLPLLRATNVDHGRIVEKGLMRVAAEDVPSTRDAFLTAGEIIVVRSGAYTADSAIVPLQYEGAVAGYDMVLRVTKGQSEFVALALLSRYLRDDQLITASLRAAQPHLNAEELGTASIVWPPITEQREIVQWTHEGTSNVDAAIERTEREIDLIREYRTRLVADVVTGKVDVRAAAAALPDEAQGTGTDQGAGGPEDGADAHGPGDGESDAEADLEPAMDGAATEGEDEA